MCMFALSASAQQDPRSTLYSQHLFSVNPAVAGSTDQGDASISLRQQMVGFKDVDGTSASPVSTWWNIYMPIKSINSGLGLTMLTDKAGFEDRKEVRLAYAYQFSLGEGRLGVGLTGGVDVRGYDFSKKRLPGTSGSDELIDALAAKKTFNLGQVGLGVFYRKDQLYCGFSVQRIYSSSLNASTKTVDYVKAHSYIVAGYDYNFANPMFVFRPSIVIQDAGVMNAWQGTLNALIHYNKYLIGGLSLTSNPDFSIVAGVDIKNGSKLSGLRVVGAFDVVTSKINAYSFWGFEIIAGYSFNMSVEKITKTYKSVRFL